MKNIKCNFNCDNGYTYNKLIDLIFQFSLSIIKFEETFSATRLNDIKHMPKIYMKNIYPMPR